MTLPVNNNFNFIFKIFLIFSVYLYMRKELKDKIIQAKKNGSQRIKSNRIYLGDNLEIMRSLEEEKIDLIYIDPPFCAQNVFKSKAWGKKVSFNDEWGGALTLISDGLYQD